MPDHLHGFAERAILVTGSIIHAGVSAGSDPIEGLEEVRPSALCRRDSLPREAGFPVGKRFLDYRRRQWRKVIFFPGFLYWRSRRQR